MNRIEQAYADLKVLEAKKSERESEYRSLDFQDRDKRKAYAKEQTLLLSQISELRFLIAVLL